jgi:hypothetical protein
MSYRQIPSTFTIKTTNTPQPLLGSWVTAVANNGFATAAGVPIVLTLGTALTSGNDASMFQKGESAWLIDPPSASPSYAETVLIQSISANTVTLGQQTDMSTQGQNPVTRFPHYAGALGTGSYLLPKQLANNLLVDLEDGGTGTFLYIGCRPNMTATAYRVFKLAKTASGVQPQYYTAALYSQGNPQDMSEYYVYGTAGDIYCVSVEIS